MTNIGKLPKWAQAEMSRLMRKNEHLALKLSRAIGVTEPSHRTPVGVNYATTEKVPLPFDSISFPAFGIHIHVGQYDRLYIRADNGSLLVKPESTNVIFVIGEERPYGSDQMAARHD
jgi:hypothetical protein